MVPLTVAPTVPALSVSVIVPETIGSESKLLLTNVGVGAGVHSRIRDRVAGRNRVLIEENYDDDSAGTHLAYNRPEVGVVGELIAWLACYRDMRCLPIYGEGSVDRVKPRCPRSSLGRWIDRQGCSLGHRTRLAVIVMVWLEVTALVVIVTNKADTPTGTVTLAGTLAAVPLVRSVTTTPPVG